MAIAPTAAAIMRVRRLSAEMSSSTYEDNDIEDALNRYPLPDADGYLPTDTAWAGEWDINRAAADIWEEKAAVLAAAFDFSADGASFSRSQAYTHAVQQAKRLRARRATSTLTLIADPPPEDAPGVDSYIGNLPEDD